MSRTDQEIRADLAICDEAERWSDRYHDAVVRLLHDVEPLLDRLAAVERLCKSFDPTSGSGRARAFVGDIRAALGAAVTPTQPEPQRDEECDHGWIGDACASTYNGSASHCPLRYSRAPALPGPVTSTPEAATETDEQRILRQMHALSREAELYWQGFDDAKAGKPGRDIGAEIGGPPSGLQRATEQQQ